MKRSPLVSLVRTVRGRSGRAVIAGGLMFGTLGVSSSLIFAAEVSGVNQGASYEPLRQAVRATPEVVESSASPLSAQIAQILEMTNAERARVGIAPLIYDIQLAQAADIHSADQRNQPCTFESLSHVGSDGSRAGDRIIRTGLSVRTWRENIACGFSGVDAVMVGWMNSAGHRANILNPDMTHTGISINFSDSGRYYWVQEFAIPR